MTLTVRQFARRKALVRVRRSLETRVRSRWMVSIHRPERNGHR
jgi:hypothetical protein